MKRVLKYLLAPILALTVGHSQASAEDKIDVALGSFGYLYVSVMVADTLGYFKEEGLDPDIQNVTSGTKAVMAVVSGSSQFTVTAPQSAFRARGEGTDLVLVGSAITQLASNVVISKAWAEKNGITDASSYEDRLKALKGSTIGITTAGSGTDQVVRFLAKQAGINADKDMTITPLGGSTAMLPAFSRGEIDGFTTSPPVPETAVDQFGGVKLFDLVGGKVKELDGFLYQGVVVREELLKSNPDMVVRFLVAIQKSLNAIRDPALSLKARDAVHAKYHAETDKALYDRIWQDFQSAFPKDITVTEDQVVRVTDFIAQFEKPIPPEAIKTGWTNQYAEEALKRIKQ